MKSFKLFLSTFKSINANFVFVVLYDLLFWLVAIIGFKFWYGIINTSLKAAATSVGAIQELTDPISQMPLMEQHHKIVTAFVRNSVFSTLLFLIVLFVAWCLFRMYIWGILADKDPTKKFMKDFILLNLAWQPFNVIISAMMFVLLGLIGVMLQGFEGYKTSLPAFVLWTLVMIPVALVIFPLTIYTINLTNILYLKFCEKRRIKLALKSMIEVAILQFRNLYIHYVFMSIVLIVLLQVFLVFTYFGENVYLVASLLMLILYSTWSKFYLVNVVN